MPSVTANTLYHAFGCPLLQKTCGSAGTVIVTLLFQTELCSVHSP